MKKVLLVGGNGFLGKHLSNKLTEYEVINPTKNQVNWVSLKGIESIVGLKPDIVIHLLAIYGGLPFCMNNRLKMALENLEINANVFRYIADENPKRIITIGSACAYPGYRDGILEEKDIGDGKLHHSVEHYGYSKIMQLQLCKALNEERGTEFEHIVLANMYGPGDIFDYEKSHAVGGIIKKFFDAEKENKPVQLLGTGRAIRDLIYAEDVAELIYRLVKLEKSTNQPLNASTGKGSSIKELVEMVANTMKFKNEVKWGIPEEDGCLVKYLSNDLIEKTLNWKPNTDLKTGIKNTIDWYRKNA